MKNIEIAKTIFLLNLDIMKKQLDLMAFKFGKNSEEFIYLKKQIMDYHYNAILKLFKDLEKEKKIKRCHCKASVRSGYSKCECGGSGYLNNETC